jgi:hypothetical protein
VSTWRDKFRPVIRRILDAGGGDNELRDEWRRMFGVGSTKGSGASWQYRIWRDEIARQTGRKRPRKRKVRSMTADEARQWMDKHQMPLF